MLIADDWKDYELIDAGKGEKLERWGKYVLRRPDPQAIWPLNRSADKWEKCDAIYHRNSSGGGKWEYLHNLPERWVVGYRSLSFYIHPMDFKHTGLFPEQAVNWNWITDRIHSCFDKVSILNLFAYTGGASVAAAHAGAEVCHVDAAKGMILRAKENIQLSGLSEKPVRFITDDVIKFVQREKRRNRFYDAIIMDPPSYGRGPDGELWKIEDSIYDLVVSCIDILAPKPLFFLINSYTTGLSQQVLKNILTLAMIKKYGGNVSAEEVGLPVSTSGLILPCGVSARWEPGIEN